MNIMREDWCDEFIRLRGEWLTSHQLNILRQGPRNLAEMNLFREMMEEYAEENQLEEEGL